MQPGDVVKLASVFVNTGDSTAYQLARELIDPETLASFSNCSKVGSDQTNNLQELAPESALICVKQYTIPDTVSIGQSINDGGVKVIFANKEGGTASLSSNVASIETFSLKRPWIDSKLSATELYPGGRVTVTTVLNVPHGKMPKGVLKITASKGLKIASSRIVSIGSSVTPTRVLKEPSSMKDDLTVFDLGPVVCQKTERHGPANQVTLEVVLNGVQSDTIAAKKVSVAFDFEYGTQIPVYSIYDMILRQPLLTSSLELRKNVKVVDAADVLPVSVLAQHNMFSSTAARNITLEVVADPSIEIGKTSEDRSGNNQFSIFTSSLDMGTNTSQNLWLRIRQTVPAGSTLHVKMSLKWYSYDQQALRWLPYTTEEKTLEILVQKPMIETAFDTVTAKQISLSIGEGTVFRSTLKLPEGNIEDLTLDILSSDSLRLDSDSIVAVYGASILPTHSPITVNMDSNSKSAKLLLGNITNIADNAVTDGDTIVIRYRLVVSPVTSNKNGAKLSLVTRVKTGFGVAATTKALHVQVIEPVLQAQVTTNVKHVQAGDSVTVTMRVSHKPGTSKSKAHRGNVTCVAGSGLYFAEASATVSTECPAGWTTVDSRCFKFDETKRKYVDSVNYCQSLGSNIASIRNDKENDVISNLIKTVAYIGAESDGKGKWKWNDGTAWWQPAATKHDGIKGTDETKIAFKPGDKKWHDWEIGADNLGVVCAKDLNSGMISAKCIV